MARKPHKVPIGALDICQLPKGWPAPPFIMVDITSILNNRVLVMERSFGAWRGVTWSIAYGVVQDIIMPDEECWLHRTNRHRFHPWEHNVNQVDGAPRDFVDHRVALRNLAFRDGASPEAVRLLHADMAFTQEEVKKMAAKNAEKLAKKAAPAKADKVAGDKPKGKGNPEALKKAREARAEAGPDVRKITIITKENPYREGSGRAASFAALKGAKTVEDYKSAGGKVKYISRWEGEGHIKLS